MLLFSMLFLILIALFRLRQTETQKPPIFRPATHRPLKKNPDSKPISRPKNRQQLLSCRCTCLTHIHMCPCALMFVYDILLFGFCKYRTYQLILRTLTVSTRNRNQNRTRTLTQHAMQQL